MTYSTRKVNFISRWLCGIVLLLLVSPSQAQSQDKQLKKLALQKYSEGRYALAYPLLKQYCQSRPRDVDALYFLAYNSFHLNELDSTLKSIQQIRSISKRIEPRVILLAAKTYHHKHDFREAIRHYKTYLTFRDVPHRQLVIDDIKRSAEGLKHRYNTDQVLIENMGDNVNSTFHDFAPVMSPNIEARVYFTSNRTLKISDQFSDGTHQASIQQRDCDMYATEIRQGAWSEAFAMNESLNSLQNEILQDFSSDGQVVFYLGGHSFDQADLKVDTFDLSRNSLGSAWQNSPLMSGESTRGLSFFADSIVLFSSNRQGGYGGYDLYICIKSGSDGWGAPINLGSAINGPYDEITPYLAKDGRTLYFSSNRLISIGGHDIFKSRFDDQGGEWSAAINLSIPINSAGNDIYYRLSRDGLSAHFSSDRKQGRGGQDLYAAYHKNPVQEQLVASTPSIFYQVKDFRLFSETTMHPADSLGVNPGLGVEVTLPSLLYRQDDQIMTTTNEKKLESLVSFLQTYPHIQLEILSHSDQSMVSNFDIYFSIKRAEEVANFLISQGVKAKRIYLRGLGGSYPYALNFLAGKPNKTGQFFNRRIDFRVHPSEKLPMSINYDMPKVAEVQKDNKLRTFYQLRRGLTYRVEFIVLDQLFKGDLIGQYPDPCVQKRADRKEYQYCSGIFKTFADALDHLSVIKAEGFEEARITPYLDGLPVDSNQLSEQMTDRYPDLREFVLYLK